MGNSILKKSSFVCFCLICLFISSNTFANKINPSTSIKKSSRVYVSQFENVMGTSFEMKTKATSNKRAMLAEKIALTEIERLSKILSAYDKNSEFSTWFKTQNLAVKVSPELLEVLSLFDVWQSKTNGALNPAFETINQVWKAAAKNQILPSSEMLQSAVHTANLKHWSIDAENQTVTHLTNTPLLLNTFVKSYIIDLATKKVLATTGIDGVVMNVGGDILVSGNENESIGIVDPNAHAINDPALEYVHVQNKRSVKG